MPAAEKAVAGAGFWKRFGVLFGLGSIGVLSLLPVVMPAARQQLDTMPDVEISYPFFVALSLLNPLILMAIGVAVGVRLAPHIGLRSYVDERVRTGAAILPRIANDLVLALVLGAIGGTLLLVLDLAFMRLAGPASLDIGLQQQPRTAAITLMGIFYGGIVEELMMRWGLMSFLSWVGWRLLSRTHLPPGPGIMWGAIIGAALGFGIGHLPAVAASIPLTGVLVVRTVLLNALGGVLFGWLFWRRSLEAAMISHGTFHIVFTLLVWVV